MDSTPKKWVLKPLSPSLQPSDLRTITGSSLSDLSDPDGLVSTSESTAVSHGDSSVASFSQSGDGWMDASSSQQDGGSTSDEWLPSSPSSTSSTYSGFYSFVEDPTSPEAERNEAWMVSPQRQTQLATLKQDREFKIQTYAGRKPESLFSDSNGDSRYAVDQNNSIGMIQAVEEKKLRKEIIRNQAPKKSKAFKGALADLDLSKSANKLIEGFCVSYSPVSPKPSQLQPPEPGSIDKQQINFSAARKQFLEMEQSELAAILTPSRSSRRHLNKSTQPDPGASSPQQVKVDHSATLFGPSENESYPEKKVVVSLTQESSVLDELDSCLEELSVEVGSSSIDDEDILNESIQERSTGMSASNYETPIEREIRLVQEREESLRRSRGLKPSSSLEMVEIQTKRLQFSQMPVKAKEKSRVSFDIQDEIQNKGEGEPQYQEGIMEGNLEPAPELEDRRMEWDHQDQRTEERPQSDEVDAEGFPSPCCPHRHSAETELSIIQMNSQPSSLGRRGQMVSVQFSDLTSPTSWSQSENLQSSGLQSRGQGAPDFIEKDIEESLRREQELQELRASREKTELFSPAPQANKKAASQFYPPGYPGMWFT